MADILRTASYVRHPRAAEQAQSHHAILASLGQQAQIGVEEAAQVWDLLETPQTVDTLCRSVGHGRALKSEGITNLLAELYDRDLIQLSPDS
jgi:hypothetical protein